MNVLKEMVDVSKTVTTCPGPSNVLVTKATIKVKMIQRDVKVCNNNNLYSCRYSVSLFHFFLDFADLLQRDKGCCWAITDR